MMRFLRSAWVIARRDFSATVLSKTFIFFLLGPLFPLLFGGVFGSISARVATQTELPEGGPEPLLKALIDGGAGIETLAIERPGLHDAFVSIAGNAAAAAMAEDKPQ